MQTLTEQNALCRPFGDALRFVVAQGGLTALEIATEQCEAQMFVHGAHVMRWVPTGQRPVLHVSPKCIYQVGKGLRGGVPICFPWFANRTDDPRPLGTPSPNHGFVRTKPWHVDAVAIDDNNGRAIVQMSTRDDDDTRALWDHAFALRLTASFGSSLTVTLAVENTGNSEFTFEQALHSYFEVGDVTRVRVEGLQAGSYIDKPDNRSVKRWHGAALGFAQEVDAVFVDSKVGVTLVDPVLSRALRIDKSGSRTTVVWNPALVLGQTIPDIGGEAWRNFACVESANALPHAIALPPRAVHQLMQRVTVLPQVAAL